MFMKFIRESTLTIILIAVLGGALICLYYMEYPQVDIHQIFHGKYIVHVTLCTCSVMTSWEIKCY